MACGSCGHVNHERARFCDQCGSRLEGARRSVPDPPPKANGIEIGDRRILFREAFMRSRQADFQQTGEEARLPRDEGGAPSGAKCASDQRHAVTASS